MLDLKSFLQLIKVLIFIRKTYIVTWIPVFYFLVRLNVSDFIFYRNNFKLKSLKLLIFTLIDIF